MRMRPCGASISQRAQPVHATSQSSRISSPASWELQATQSRWLSLCRENKSLGQTSTQSPQAVHSASSTTGMLVCVHVDGVEVAGDIAIA